MQSISAFTDSISMAINREDYDIHKSAGLASGSISFGKENFCIYVYASLFLAILIATFLLSSNIARHIPCFVILIPIFLLASNIARYISFSPHHSHLIFVVLLVSSFEMLLSCAVFQSCFSLLISVYMGTIVYTPCVRC